MNLKNLTRTSALAAGLVLMGLGGAKAADVLVEQDRYAEPQDYADEGPVERRWRGESYEYESRRVIGRYPGPREEVVVAPPALVPPGRIEERRVLVERPRWQQRPVVSGRIFEDDDEEECRLVIRRRTTLFGEVIEERRQECD